MSFVRPSKEAEITRRENPVKFRQFVSSNPADYFQVFIATDKRVIAQRYRVNVDSDGHLSVALVDGGDCTEGDKKCVTGSVLVLGNTEEITRLTIVETSFESGWMPYYAELARFLVGLEITNHPLDTRPPIDVLEINRKTITWISSKPECANQ